MTVFLKLKLVMKIILSRKGFDSEFGGQPSPILPDGTLLSLPIPSKHESIFFKELAHKGKSYYDIIKELDSDSKIKEKYTCHLDPDLRGDIYSRPYFWQPLFGQADTAQSHLNSQGVGKGDLFLFFGTFRQTEEIDGKLHYEKKSKEKHVIFGYMQIGAVHNDCMLFPKEISYHPHATPLFTERKNNCIYAATNELSLIPSKKGAGCFEFDKKLILTKEGYSKSRWALPDFFKTIDISYHTKDSFKDEYFQSAAKGQEFVMNADEKVLEWVKNLFIHTT